MSELQPLQFCVFNKEELISPKLDWLALKTKFDAGAEASPIRYALSIKNLTEYLIPKFDEYVNSKSDVISELKEISAPPALLPNPQKVRADLENFHRDAIELHEKLMNVENSLGLTELNSTRPTFALITETLTEKIRQVLLKVEVFEVMPEFVRSASLAANSKYVSSGHEDVAKEKIFDLIRYVIEGRFRKKLGESTAAELILNNLQLFRKNLPESDSSQQLEILCKTMCEVTERLEDAWERLWLETTLKGLEQI